ncbi:hypothetical protein FPHYL_13461 [Fusarium phyllophilum]|uniref:Uncharacterized protein n=1 Tax=Fusarium phyllophilum TaxID=47803 RepID=A0A8H5IE09_9HYPO|nr:hypothetical protein FPHYL_13461 [Fusarium phyllophilum]
MSSIILHMSMDNLERLLDRKLQPIKDHLNVINDKLDAINKMPDNPTNHGLAPKSLPVETVVQPQDQKLVRSINELKYDSFSHSQQGEDIYRVSYPTSPSTSRTGLHAFSS